METSSTLVNLCTRYGEAMSPILFSLLLEKIVRKINIKPQEGVILQEFSVALLAYTDDLILIAKVHNNLRSLFDQLEDLTRKIG